MPFGQQNTPEYERNLKIYTVMIKPVVIDCGYESIRADELEHVGSITRDIIELLHDSELVIADLTGRNANVFYELGVRHVLYRCGTIPIISEGETLPFDIASYRAVFYSSELDGPKKFQNELKRRIKAFEKIPTKRPDNPVHDILGESLQYVNLKDYVSLIEYKEKKKEINKLKNEFEALKKQNSILNKEDKNLRNKVEKVTIEKKDAEEKIIKLEKQIQTLEQNSKQTQHKSHEEKEVEKSSGLMPKFRSQPSSLSENDVKKMLLKNNFFDIRWNKKGKFDNQLTKNKIQDDEVVIDESSGLVWQQSGSLNEMKYEYAKNWIEELNKKLYAGYSDWRLPTLEEAMSLMEPEKKEGLYIDPLFDKNQKWIWTSDLVKGESAAAWVVYFNKGYCYYNYFTYYSIVVRAVRSVEQKIE